MAVLVRLLLLRKSMMIHLLDRFSTTGWAIMGPNYRKRSILLALLSLFPDDGNGSRVMLTTRLRNVALYAAGSTRNIHYIRFLNKDESWELLRDIVFAGKSCSYELEKIGKEIAENCQGLPLTIVVIGFLKPKRSKTLEKVAEECLEELVDRSLVLVHNSRSTSGIKTCSVHSAVWHLCVSAAEKDKFFLAINSPLSSVHWPNHSHPLRVCLGFTFLRVLDVLTIRFYKFPDGILELVLLRYLALTCKAGDLPTTVSKLCNLQFLIVRRHMSIKSSGDPSFYRLRYGI
ncbi:UNVERIFIED_CONTAM: putative disease resistance protein [Sesamum radiatum]|uniref:Disease resistance protein n=1 Tax=Sesamum radiatum TaxID=300843 RepID=A0AAW2WGZ0_SESRA